MISENQNIKISKFLSLVLRHRPQTIGITLDAHGWTDVDVLLQKSAAAGVPLTLELLTHVVETNNKKRFAFNNKRDKIRASQGHSIAVELGYIAQEPPEVLYHGTASSFIKAILQSGIDKKGRHHVHLSKELDTALQVGQRHGKPYVFKVMARQMFNDGYAFYLSENKVWLTDHVPARYLIATG